MSVMQADEVEALYVLAAHVRDENSAVDYYLRHKSHKRPSRRSVAEQIAGALLAGFLWVLLFAFSPPKVEKRVTELFLKWSRVVHDTQLRKRDARNVVLASRGTGATYHAQLMDRNAG